MNGDESDRIDELEARMDMVEAALDDRVGSYLVPMVEELAEGQEKMDVLREKITEQSQRIDELESNLDDLVGLADSEQSTPGKRASDLRQLLKRRARARTDAAGTGTAQMYYKDVIDSLAEHGHGTIHAPQAKQAMQDAADREGFEIATTKMNVSDTRTDIRDVEVIRVDLTALAGEGPVNEINNGKGGTPGGATATDGGQPT